MQFSKPININITQAFTLILAFFFSINYYHKAFPLLDDLTFIDKSDILTQALSLSDQQPYQNHAAQMVFQDQAVLYLAKVDHSNKIFKVLQNQKLFNPYQWQVRLFNFEQTQETYWQFNPDGQVTGFQKIIEQDTPGAQLPQEQAKILVENFLKTGPVEIDLENYHLINNQMATNRSGRIDHSFTYAFKQPIDSIIPDTFRLTVKLCGDEVSSISQTVFIPESFTTEYASLRSLNMLFSQIGGISTFILIITTLLISLIYLRPYVQWQFVLKSSLFLSLISLASQLNQYPFFYLNYSTQLSQSTYLTGLVSQIIISTIMIFILSASIFSISYAFYRYSNPNKLQMKYFIPSIISQFQPSINGVYASYAYTIGLFALQTAYFYFGQNLVWIAPTSLQNPNILATYLPWLGPLSTALNAGILEECLYRALPLSMGYLLGRKLGYPKTMTTICIISSSILFGLMHASYPIDPPYARVIETGLIAIVFCIIYLRHGLLSAILTHVLFDLIIMSMPIFYTDHLFNTCISVVLIFLPLIVTLLTKLKQTSVTHHLPEQYYNHLILATTPHTPAKEQVMNKTYCPSLNYRFGLLGIALITLAITLFPNPNISSQLPSQTAAKTSLIKPIEHLVNQLSDAKEIQIGYIATSNYYLGYFWHTKLLETALDNQWMNGPRWQLSVYETQGDANQRSESIASQQTSWHHHLPGTTSRASLSESGAKQMAIDYYRSTSGQSDVTITAIESINRDNRTDWIITILKPNDSEINHIRQLEKIQICGDQICKKEYAIELPEENEREYQAMLSQVNLLNWTQKTILILGGIGLLVYALTKSHPSTFNRNRCLKYLSLSCVVVGLQYLLSWPQFVFITRDPINPYNWFSIYTQAMFAITTQASVIALLALMSLPEKPVTQKPIWLLLLCSALLSASFPSYPANLFINALLLAIVMYRYFNNTIDIHEPLWLAGVFLIMYLFCSSFSIPQWQDYSHLANIFPELSLIINQFITVGVRIMLMHLLAQQLTQFTQYWTTHQTKAVLILFISGFCLSPTTLSWTSSILIASLMGITTSCTGYWFIRQQRQHMIPLFITITWSITVLAQAGLDVKTLSLMSLLPLYSVLITKQLEAQQPQSIGN